MDRDYRITAKSHGLAIDVRYDTDILQFPIEMARLRSFFYLAHTAIAATVGYGWSIEAKAVSLLPGIDTNPDTELACCRSFHSSINSWELPPVLSYSKCSKRVAVNLSLAETLISRC